ncbi:MAG TPA: hypothetical protein VJH89_00245 [Patescibacteria group bacterium]|nr:hypothetical protein [Patescibacteria group bacterium]
MFKKLFIVSAGAIILSGCSANVPQSTTVTKGSIWKSFDSGATFVPKVTVDETQRITSSDVLSFVFDPKDSQVIYLGTKANGIFKTTDGAEHWEAMKFPPLKVYGLAIDHADSSKIYASGVYNNVAKLYRLDSEENMWKEIYTEPGEGAVITALGSSPDASGVLYVGMSTGVVLKSMDGGATWKNIFVAKGPVTKILFHKEAPKMVTLLVFNKNVMVSWDEGETWNDQTTLERLSTRVSTNVATVEPQAMTTIALDPVKTNVIFGGAQNGLFRSEDNGKKWQALKIIESSKKFPARAIAINPHNANEITYVAGKVLYRSLDGGIRWSTVELPVDRGVSVIEYDPLHPEIMYFALRKF